MSVEAEVSPGSREKRSTKRTRSRRRSRRIGELNLIKSTISRRCPSFCLAVPRSSHGSLIFLFDASESFLTVCFRQLNESGCSMFAPLHRNIPSNSQRWFSIAGKPRTRPRLLWSNVTFEKSGNVFEWMIKRRVSQKFSATVADHKSASREVQLGSDQIQGKTLSTCLVLPILCHMSVACVVWLETQR